MCTPRLSFPLKQAYSRQLEEKVFSLTWHLRSLSFRVIRFFRNLMLVKPCQQRVANRDEGSSRLSRSYSLNHQTGRNRTMEPAWIWGSSIGKGAIRSLHYDEYSAHPSASSISEFTIPISLPSYFIRGKVKTRGLLTLFYSKHSHRRDLL